MPCPVPLPCMRGVSAPARSQSLQHDTSTGRRSKAASERKGALPTARRYADWGTVEREAARTFT